MSEIALDLYIIETLMPDLVGHDRQPSAFLVYLFLWAATSAGTQAASLSLGRIAEGTGVSKRAVQDAVSRLVQRHLVTVERESTTAVPTYTIRAPWKRKGQPA